MKKKFVKLLSLATAMVVAVAGFTGCGKSEKELSGSITLAGSTSMEKVCEALMEGFMEKYPEVFIHYCYNRIHRIRSWIRVPCSRKRRYR